jgi:hypothetical protein
VATSNKQVYTSIKKQRCLVHQREWEAVPLTMVMGTNEIKRARGAHLSSASTLSLLWVGYVQIVTHSSIQQNLSLI